MLKPKSIQVFDSQGEPYKRAFQIFLDQLASCDIHLATGCGPWENSGPTYQMSAVLASRGIAHHLDDWGPKGGHEWPYWHHQMWEYMGAHF